MEIEFNKCLASGYRERTIENAKADVTIAIAINFETAGEILTKKAVLNQGKLYVPISYKTLTEERIIRIVDFIDSKNNKPFISLNIAGNGLYTMSSFKITQQMCDDFTFELLSEITSRLKTRVELVRSGGQTGFDEAGIKAAKKLGYKTLVYAPKFWTFRDEKGIDIHNEKLFKARFYD